MSAPTRSQSRRNTVAAARPPQPAAAIRRTRRASFPRGLSGAVAGELRPLVPTEDSKLKSYSAHLDRVEAFEAFSAEKKQDVARALRETVHKQGDAIVTQGEVGDRFYILVQGSVSIIKDGNKVNQLVASRKALHFFGERALLTKDVRAATVKVISPSATTLSMGKASFDVLLRPSLVGPRRVAAAMTRRLLQDARERHVLRESYKARASAECRSNGDYIPVIRVEGFGDVLAAVKAARRSHHIVEILKEDMKRRSNLTQRLQALMCKLRCYAHCVGRMCALAAHARAKIAADHAWKELHESLATASESLGLASFGVDRGAPEGFGLNPVEITERRLGAQRDGERSVTLGGGNVAAALRSVRKAVAHSQSLPRSPASLLKRVNPEKNAVTLESPKLRGAVLLGSFRSIQTEYSTNNKNEGFAR